MESIWTPASITYAHTHTRDAWSQFGFRDPRLQLQHESKIRTRTTSSCHDIAIDKLVALFCLGCPSPRKRYE